MYPWALSNPLVEALEPRLCTLWDIFHQGLEILFSILIYGLCTFWDIFHKGLEILFWIYWSMNYAHCEIYFTKGWKFCSGFIDIWIMDIVKYISLRIGKLVLDLLIYEQCTMHFALHIVGYISLRVGNCPGGLFISFNLFCPNWVESKSKLFNNVAIVMLPNWLNARASLNQRYFPFKQEKVFIFMHVLKGKLDYFSQIAQTFFSSKW